MQKINCIIIDDEPIARQYLGDYVARMPQLQLLATFSRAVDAYGMIESGETDLVFLDIQMPGLTGIEFMHTLQKKPAIVLTTAYSEYALQGYELDVMDYLLKPISFERFARSVAKVISRQTSSPEKKENSVTEPMDLPAAPRDFIFVKSGYKSVKVNIADILYVEGMKEYVVIYTKTKKYTKLDRMKNIETQLNDQGFVRIHKSYIVSVRNIDAVFGNTVEINDIQLPIGRSFKEELNSLLGISE